MFLVDSSNIVYTESSSKGNQHKFYKNGYWIKLDGLHRCEGLAEDFVSCFESCIYDFPYVYYKSDNILYNEERYLGCCSYNMYNRLDTSFVSLRSLLRNAGIPLNITFKLENTADNIRNTVGVVQNITGLNLLSYFGRLLFLDALILNEDRHIMNLGVVYCSSDNRFYEAPCFDNGSSLFCVNWTYRARKTLDENIKFAQSVARPFSKFYDKQVDALLSLGCKPLIVNKTGVVHLLSEYRNPLYSDEMNQRIKAVLKNRLEHYYNKVYVWGVVECMR